MGRAWLIPIIAALTPGFADRALAGSRPPAPLLWSQQSWYYYPPYDPPGQQQSASVMMSAIVPPPGTPPQGTPVISCDGSTIAAACVFGRPALSPGHNWVIVSRRAGFGLPWRPSGPGTLVMAGLYGGPARALRRLTADDEQPQFLPSGRGIVFTGRPKPGARPELYEAALDGGRLRRLTFRGGSWPAPCRDGVIVFERGADLWLIPRRGPGRRLVRDGSQPDCAPNAQTVVFVARNAHALGIIGLNGRHLRYLLRQPATPPELVGALASPAFSASGRSIAALRKHEIADGSGDELDIANLPGVIRSREDLAETSTGSQGSGGEQSSVPFIAW